MFQKTIGLTKDELGGQIVKEFVALGPTINIYLVNDLCVVEKKATSKKRC